MNLMLFGAQELEKELKQKFLIEKYNIPQISTGDILKQQLLIKQIWNGNKNLWMKEN